MKEEVTRRRAGTKMASRSNKVFVVHGHDNEMKESVARVLETLGLKPVILHEQANMGRTIIEKFEDHADVGFAVVLLSGDDMAYPTGGDKKKARPRARQNVMLELGFFIGHLGRDRVAVLFKGVDDFEHPSDMHGVLYEPFDDAGNWRYKVAKELKAAEYDVDLNKL